MDKFLIVKFGTNERVETIAINVEQAVRNVFGGNLSIEGARAFGEWFVIADGREVASVQRIWDR